MHYLICPHSPSGAARPQACAYISGNALLPVLQLLHIILCLNCTTVLYIRIVPNITLSIFSMLTSICYCEINLLSLLRIFVLELPIQRATPYIVNFDQSMYSIDESSGQVLITVFLDEPPSTDITVVVFTTDGSATGKHTTNLVCNLDNSFI